MAICQHAPRHGRVARTLSSFVPSCSLTYCVVRVAKGVKEVLLTRCQRAGCEQPQLWSYEAMEPYPMLFPKAENLSMAAAVGMFVAKLSVAAAV